MQPESAETALFAAVLALVRRKIAGELPLASWETGQKNSVNQLPY